MADLPHAVPAGQTDSGLSGVVVLGMHRSGTSAVNGIFRAAGFRVTSEEDTVQADRTQPGGYNESWAVMQLNNTILGEIGRTWFEPPAAEEFAAVLDSGRQRAGELLDLLLEAAAPAPLALKDPRINVMMPIWGPLIDGVLHPVLVIRDPVEVARSLGSRDGTPRPIALASWEACMSEVLAHLSGRQTTIVHYRELIASPSLAVEIVGSVTDLLAPRFVPQADPARAADEIDPGLHRNQADDTEHAHALTQHQERLWKFLDGLPGGTQTLSVPAEFTATDPGTRAITRAETERLALMQRVKILETSSPTLRRRVVDRLEPVPFFHRIFVVLRVTRRVLTSDQAAGLGASARGMLGTLTAKVLRRR